MKIRLSDDFMLVSEHKRILNTAYERHDIAIARAIRKAHGDGFVYGALGGIWLTGILTTVIAVMVL